MPLSGHSMVRLGQGQAIFGGLSNSDDYQTKIYLMGCSNRNCIISLLNRALSVPKYSFVAISIPDTISGCITGSKKYYQKNLKDLGTYIQPNIYFILKYSMPVPKTDWGWVLPGFQQQSTLFF